MEDRSTERRIALDDAVAELLEANGGDEDDVRSVIDDAIHNWEADQPDPV